MASGPAMSSRAASAAQASRKDAATTAVPNASEAERGGRVHAAQAQDQGGDSERDA